MIDGVKRSITLTDPAEVDSIIERLRAPQYTPNSLAIIIEGGAARALMGHSVVSLLADTPAKTLAAIERLRPSAPTSFKLNDGFVIDLDAKRLLGMVAEVPAWPGWDCRVVHHADELAAYLGERGLGIPMERAPESDPLIEAIVAPLALGLYERTEYLLAANRELPNPKEPLRATTVIGLVLLLVCLPLRLLALPFRGAARARHERAAVAHRAHVREQLAKVADAATTDARIDRALYLSSLGHRDVAERELTACLDAEPTRALVRWNRGVVRMIPFRKLARRDMDEARAQGYRPPKASRDLRGFLGFLVGL